MMAIIEAFLFAYGVLGMIYGACIVVALVFFGLRLLGLIFVDWRDAGNVAYQKRRDSERRRLEQPAKDEQRRLAHEAWRAEQDREAKQYWLDMRRHEEA